MAISRYVIDRAKIDRFIKEGRGKGEGKEYKPWLTVYDVPSDGRVHRPRGLKTNRTHHLLSDIEYRHFLLLEWDPDVKDIREQFPLDLDRTQAIAREAGIRHPRDTRSDEDNVMTSDFLVVVGEGKRRKLVVWAVKPAEKLNDKRVVEKLEIERRYWMSIGGAEWHISTELELPMPRIESLEWLRGASDLADVEEPSEGFLGVAAERIVSCIGFRSAGEQKLNALCASLDTKYAAPNGAHQLIARHLLAHSVLLASLDRRKMWETDIADIEIDKKKLSALLESLPVRPLAIDEAA
ncbi:TnsA endonuclease N-terminal domain-containing protein [Paraburkholderia tropica]|uniref:TnsA endonuclease N-terminal domain-containing protein n=1 Tax=Paraburkholderia tropica TaxID=92647 RepID=UPI002ABEA285|nr:TnsA endonuclease N-terminal domain-containing protein [Paraburkholderia tropica]